MAKVSETKLKRFMEQASTMKNDPDYPIYEAGLQEGKRVGMSAALSFLETKYMHPSIKPDSEEAKAILSVTRQLANHLREVL